jgi:NAD(P)-dependent dehydrogenase (short-subunit alcohol dehydrogenase family)
MVIIALFCAMRIAVPDGFCRGYCHAAIISALGGNANDFSYELVVLEALMRTAIVTGANRGVGRGVAKQLVLLGYQTILTSRDELKGKQTVHELKKEIGINLADNLVYHQLDVTSTGSVHRLYSYVVEKYEAADVLVNNAAVLLDQCGRVLQTPMDTYRTDLNFRFQDMA